MKVKEAGATENEFKPITIEITFESVDELKEWWHRFNVPIHHCANFGNGNKFKISEEYDEEGVEGIWNLIDDKLDELDAK